jgi:hypothetical protein
MKTSDNRTPDNVYPFKPKLPEGPQDDGSNLSWIYDIPDADIRATLEASLIRGEDTAAGLDPDELELRKIGKLTIVKP